MTVTDWTIVDTRDIKRLGSQKLKRCQYRVEENRSGPTYLHSFVARVAGRGMEIQEIGIAVTGTKRLADSKYPSRRGPREATYRVTA